MSNDYFGKLILANPEGVAEEFTLTQAEVTLGSADTNDIVLPRAKVSRAHARIDCTEEGNTVVDLDSIAGTIVNNLPVKRINLANGDIIQLGEAMLRFEAADSLGTAGELDATILDNAIFAEEEPIPVENEPAAGQKGRSPSFATAQAQGSGAKRKEALVEIQPGGAKRPFFCVGTGYDTQTAFAELAQHLGEEQPFYALQIPTLSDGSQAAGEIETLAAYYVDAIRNVQTEGTYRLGGFNIGGVVAFEVAQQLMISGSSVSALILLDTPYPIGNSLPYWGYRSAQTVNRINDTLTATLTQPLQGVLSSNMGQMVSLSAQKVREMVEPRLPKQLQRLEEDYLTFTTSLSDKGYEAILQMTQSYQPKIYPGRVTLILAEESPVRYSGALWQWHLVAPNGLDTRLVPGSHSSILRESNVRMLAQQLQSCLS